MDKKYEKTVWKPRKGTDLGRFKKSQETSNYVTLENAPTSITEPGVLFSPRLMNHLEDGVESAHNGIEEIASRQAAIEQEIAYWNAAAASESQQRAQGDIDALNAAKNYADQRASALGAVLDGVQTLTLSGALLTRVINGTTPVAKNLFDPSTVFVAGKTLMGDANGTIGVCRCSIDGATVIVDTLSISPISSNEPTLIGNVSLHSSLPQSVADAAAKGWNTPKLGDYAQVLRDETLGNQRVEWYISAIDAGGNMTWGNPVIINTSDYQAQTTAQDAGRLLTGGAAPGTFGASLGIDTVATQGSNNPISSGAAFNALANKLDAGLAYGTCTTSAGTAAKVGTLSGFVRSKGIIVGLKFSNTNTAADPTLNVNSSGAAPILDYRTGEAVTPRAIGNRVHYFQFDGTNWLIMNPVDTWLGYGTCATGASTAAKVGTLSGFVRTVGVIVGIKFSNANTAADPTLNVNSSGAAPILDYRTGEAVTPRAIGNRVHFFQFDGTNWLVMNPVDTWLGYGTCTTAASTAAKVGTLAGFVRTVGVIVGIKFSNANSAADPTLNVNLSGAAPILDYRTGTAALVGTMSAGVHFFQYDGTNWILINPIPVKVNNYNVCFKISSGSDYLTFDVVVDVPVFTDGISGNAAFVNIQSGEFRQAMGTYFLALNTTNKTVTRSVSGMWQGAYINYVCLCTIDANTLRLTLNSTNSVYTSDITQGSNTLNWQFAVNVTKIS